MRHTSTIDFRILHGGKQAIVMETATLDVPIALK